MNNEQVDQNNSNYFKLISDTINNLIAHVPSNKSSNGLQQKNKQRYSDLLKRYNTFFGTIEKVGQDRMKLYKLLIGQFSSVPYYHEVKETIDNLFNTYEKISVISTEILDQIPLETIDTTEILDQIQLENKDTTQILDQIEENVNLLENLFKFFLLRLLVNIRHVYIDDATKDNNEVLTYIADIKERYFDDVDPNLQHIFLNKHNLQQFKEELMKSDDGSDMGKIRTSLYLKLNAIINKKEGEKLQSDFINDNSIIRETSVQRFFDLFLTNLSEQWIEFGKRLPDSLKMFEDFLIDNYADIYLHVPPFLKKKNDYVYDTETTTPIFVTITTTLRNFMKNIILSSTDTILLYTSIGSK